MAFINSKVKLAVRLSDGRIYSIPKDFLGDVPDEVAKSWLVQAAIRSGHIIAPEAKTDKAIEKAAEEVKKPKKKA